MKKYAFILIFFIFCLLSTSHASEDKVSFSTEIELAATRERVWRALTTEKDLGQWWNPGVILQPKVGGIFYEPWGDDQLATGSVTSLEIQKFIKFTWKEKYFKEDQRTNCEFSLKESAGKIILTVKHGGWESFEDKKQREDLIKGFQGGWEFFLGKLKAYVEN